MKDSALFEINNDKHSELFEEKWKMLDTNHEENFARSKRGEKFDLCDDYFDLKKKYTVEVALLEIKMKEIDIICDKLEKRIYNLGATFIHDNSSKKKIKNNKRKILEKEVCGICCEKHELRQIITTACNHHFGKCCLAKYVTYNFDNYLEIICPMCRNDDITKLTKYIN
jgi:hypothetical protein